MIVTDTANKDDGGHIVDKQPLRLRTLSKGPSTIIIDGVESTAEQNLHFQYLRQIAYEALHSEELLNLVEPGFCLQTDESYECEQKAAKLSRLTKLSSLYEAAKKLPRDSLEQIIEILEYINSERGEIPEPNEVRLYLLIKWTEASAFEHIDSERSLSAALALCKRYKEILIPNGLAVYAVDIYVEAIFDSWGQVRH
jgi:hypothetical protein